MEIFELLKSVVKFWQRQWKLVFMFAFSGLVLGYVYDLVKKPYYESSAIVTSGLSYFEGIIDPNELVYPIIDQKIAIDMVNSIGDIVKSSENEILASKLMISSDIASTIKSIDAEQLYELDIENRRQKLSQFLIKIRVSENTSIPLVQQGIFDYFTKNAYTNKNYTLFKEQGPSLIYHLEQEINDLKEYRKELKGKSNAGMSSISIANNRSEIMQNQIVQLYEKKQDLERDLKLLAPLSYVSEFPIYENPKNRMLIRMLALGILFFLIGFFYAIISEVKTSLD